MEPILIITRPAPLGSDFAAAVTEAYGGPLPIIFAPALQITPLNYIMPEVAHVIFTSARAVARAPDGTGLTAWCVGNATAQAALSKGFNVENAAGDADALVKLIGSQRPVGPMVHLAGRHRRGDIAARLTAAGLHCTTVEVYDQIAVPIRQELIAAAAGSAPLVVPIFSPRSAQNVLKLNFAAPLHIVAISDAVAGLFHRINTTTLLTVGHPDADHMRDMTVAVMRSLSDAGD